MLHLAQPIFFSAVSSMILTLIVSLSVLIWIYLLAFNGRFWFGGKDLERADGLETWPDVVAVIPARNEADTIGAVVGGHLQSDYPGHFQVIVVDDQSDDGTGQIVRGLAETGPRAVDVVDGTPLPKGWSGKLWAVHNGLNQVSKIAPNAQYVLLTDADIVHAPGTLQKLVAKAEREDRVLVSVMAMLDARWFWGALLMPAFIFFFQKLYPFHTTNDPSSDVAGAAGGCMLVRRDTLVEIGGIEAIQGALIDDCSLALKLKDPQGERRNIWLGFDKGVQSLRDNREFHTIWTMVKRTAYTQLHYNPLFLVGAVVGMIFTYLIGPILFFTLPWHGSGLAFTLGTWAWLGAMVGYCPTLFRYNKSPLWALALPLVAFLYTCMTVASAISHYAGHGGAWKGRTYS